MRFICAALAMLISFAVTASAQDVAAPPSVTKEPARMSPDDVVARLMLFDRNNDFKIAIDELPDRMQTLVVRGDQSDDLMLDAREIRRMTAFGPEMPVLFKSAQFAIYGFLDTGTLSTRTHIENSIDDLRLAPQAAQEAKRVALALADDFERTSPTNAGQRLTDERRALLVTRLSSLLTEEERDNLNAALARRPLVKRTGLDDVVHPPPINGQAIKRAVDPVVR